MMRGRFSKLHLAIGMMAFAALLGLFHNVAEGNPLSQQYLSEPFSSVILNSNMLNLDEIIQKAQETGGVRVIIHLNVPFKPEGELHVPAAIQAQRNGIAKAQEAITRRLGSFNANVLRRFKYVPIMVAVVDSEGLADLVNNPDVAHIQEDEPVPPTLSDSVPLIGGDQAWAMGYTGSGQTIAILDTGVESSHSFFEGRVVAEACFSTTDAGYGSTTLCPNGLEEQIGVGAGVNCSGVDGCDHGTHVAGIAAGYRTEFAGVAPDANIISVQIFSRFDNDTYCGAGKSPCVLTWSSDQISALEWVYEQRMSFDIASINMSIGGGQYTSNCDSDSRKFYIDNLRSEDIATVIASGNNGYREALNAPACISSAISVGATSKSDYVTYYSNVASFLSLLATGDSIWSSVPEDVFGTKSGTSMAAPHVAGAWAVLKSKVPSASVDQVLTALQDTGVLIDDLRSGAVVTDMPRIQVDAALGELNDGTPTPTPVDTYTPTATATSTPTATATPTPSNTPTPTPTPTDTPFGMPTLTPTATLCPYEYSITDLGTLGGDRTYAYDINESGQVVGESRTASDDWHAFLWESGVMTDLGTLGGYSSYATSINDSGQIAGSAQTITGDDRAFLWEIGSMEDLGTLGGSDAYGEGINSSGQVVGSSVTADWEYHTFLWENDVMSDLGTLGSDWSWPYDVNDSGQVVGESFTPDWDLHAFFYDGAIMEDLGVLSGGDYSIAYGINNSEQIVGYSNTSSGDFRGFLYENESMTELGTLGGTDSFANGINNVGQIVGSAKTASDETHAVLWYMGEITDLNDRIVDNPGWALVGAEAINESGYIVGYGDIGGQRHSFLLTPLGCLVPTETPTNTVTPTAISTSTPTPTLTNTPTETHTPTDTPTSTPTATFTPTPTETSTSTPTSTATSTPTSTHTSTPTATMTAEPIELLINGEFEIFVPNWWRGNRVTTADGPDCSTSASGLCSMKLEGNGDHKQVSFITSISGSAGDEFNLSLWNKADGSDRPFYAKAVLVYTDASEETFRLIPAKGTHDWAQYQLDFTAAKDYNRVRVFLVYGNGSGTVWFDDVSLAVGPMSTEVVKNSTFDVFVPNWWRGNSLLSTDGSDCGTSALGACSTQLEGNGDHKQVTFITPTSGSAGDGFTFRLWNKADSSDRPFYAKVVLVYTDASQEIFRLLPAKGTHDWAPYQLDFSASKDFNRVRVFLVYGYGSGAVWFDDISLLQY